MQSVGSVAELKANKCRGSRQLLRVPRSSTKSALSALTWTLHAVLRAARARRDGVPVLSRLRLGRVILPVLRPFTIR